MQSIIAFFLKLLIAKNCIDSIVQSVQYLNEICQDIARITNATSHMIVHYGGLDQTLGSLHVCV